MADGQAMGPARIGRWLERAGLRRPPGPRPPPTRQQILEFELRVHRGELTADEAVAELVALARLGEPIAVLSALSRLHCSGLREERFLRFAVDYAVANRELAAAQRYAESLRHDLRPGGQALRQLALIHQLRGSYSAAASLYREHLQDQPRDSLARSQLGTCELRRGDLRAALACFRQAGGLAPEDERWLAEVVESGRRRPRRDWFGRATRPMERLGVHDWRSLVLKARLRFQTRSTKQVDLWINGCRYVPDERLFGVPDHWQTPDKTEQRRMGDCEDFALWAWVQLLRQGLSCRFVVGGLFSEELNHAWVQIYDRGRVSVLECTPTGHNVPVSARCAPEYRPILSLAGHLRWFDHTRGGRG